MSARGSMTMRLEVERDLNASGARDNRGQPKAPDFQPASTIPGLAWIKQRKAVLDDGKEATIEDMRAIVPVDADVQEGDRISKVTNRLGSTIIDGPAAVGTIIPKMGSGSSVSHWELMLTRHK